ncbi:intermembrane phospholipid transport protein YdbH family protein [Desulfobacter latus]|uniref:YdbH domain-containing protein n=1 Tax=Desulfobacter latus TaxID=2292 RepID=A0A850T6D5_9BACT|nr:YdbH domain-containing protein [Desulfobacter latus]NWH04912.1 YdbH domain-containing protein [Desulfobacter latus]
MPFKIILKILLPALLLFVLSIPCIIVFLPAISKHIVQSALGPLPGGRPLDFKVSRLGINNTQISDISFGEDLRLDTIQFSYHMDIKNIISVEKLVMSGLNVTLHLDEKKRIRVSGFSFPQANKLDHPGPAFDPDISAFESYFKYLPAHIILKNSTIFIETGKDRFYIPMQADVQLDRKTRLADMKLSIFPMNQEITVGATANLIQGAVHMRISADRFYPEMLLAMVPGGHQALSKFCGPVNFAIDTKDFSTFYAEVNDLGLAPDPHLKIKFPKISGVLSCDQTAMTLKADGPVQIRSPGIDLGSFKFEILSQIVSGTLDQFSLTLQNETTKTWNMMPKRMALPLSPVDFSDQIQLFAPRFRLSVSGNLEHQTGKLAVTGTDLKSFRHNQAEYTNVLDISGLQVTTEFNGNFGDPESLKHIKFNALIDKIAVQQTMKDKGIQVKGFYFELPVTYPFKDIKAVGRAGAKKVILHDKIAPAVSAELVQTSDVAMDIAGKVRLAELPDLIIDFSARAGLDSSMSPFAKGQINTNQFSITPNTLIPLVPAISGVEAFKFDISAKADFSYINQRINSSADIQVSNGMLNAVESGFSISGISADIHLNDLMVPETLPGQYINIDAFNAGRFNCSNGKIRFSLEDGKSIHIENLKFNWCNGIVSTEAFRLPSEDNTLYLTLYCDRLEMKDLFHQLGAFDAEGGGTLSGRIPVVLKKTEIGFDKGFLFSTPGDGGRILIRNFDKMLTGIPKNTREFSQLDLAGEALKNFEYNWVKLMLNTHGDTLEVNMQLDGKPLSVLPFEYNRTLNSFVRVDAQSPGSNFQGIKLDVNLTLPFNQVIQFGNNLKRIMNP